MGVVVVDVVVVDVVVVDVVVVDVVVVVVIVDVVVELLDVCVCFSTRNVEPTRKSFGVTFHFFDQTIG